MKASDERRLRNILKNDSKKLAKSWTTAYHYACKMDCKAIVCQTLYDLDFDLYQTDNLGASVLHHACYRGNLSIAQWTLNKDLDPNALSYGKETPVHWCVAGGAPFARKLIQLLHSRGANVNAQDLNGDTALHLACKQGEPALATTLLELGARPTIKNKDLQMPHQCADRNAGADCKTIIRIELYKKSKNKILAAKADIAFEEVKQIILNQRKLEKKQFATVVKVLRGKPEDLIVPTNSAKKRYSQMSAVQNPLREEAGDGDDGEETKDDLETGPAPGGATELEHGKDTLIPFAVPEGSGAGDEINVLLPDEDYFAIVRLPAGVDTNPFCYITVSLDGAGVPIAVKNRHRSAQQDILDDLASVSKKPATKALTEEWIETHLKADEETGCRYADL